MTKIVFHKWDNVFYGFSEQGHTGYADAGEDILCSALSAMTMLIINTIEVSYASDVDYEIDDDDTRIVVTSKAALPEYEESLTVLHWMTSLYGLTRLVSPAMVRPISTMVVQVSVLTNLLL